MMCGGPAGEFLDEVDHDALMQRIRDEVKNKDALRLIGKNLRTGELVNKRKIRHKDWGIPQGEPLSPWLAEYLPELSGS